MTTLTLPKPPKSASFHEIDHEELIALCPACKTFETIYFSADGLLPTRKFRQDDNNAYHDCGTAEPCRLFRIV